MTKCLDKKSTLIITGINNSSSTTKNSRVYCLVFSQLKRKPGCSHYPHYCVRPLSTVVAHFPILTSKEKYSLTRKLVGYWNWRQWWCKKEGNKVLRKGNETKILYLALLLVLLHLHVLNIGFLSHYPFLKTLFPSFLHHHCLQFLYPTNFLVRECFSLLVSSILLILASVPPPPPPPPRLQLPSRADAPVA